MITSHPLAGSHFHSCERRVRSARTGYNSTGIRDASCHTTKNPSNKQSHWQKISPRHCACGAELAPGPGSRPRASRRALCPSRACGPVTRTRPTRLWQRLPVDPCIALRAVWAGSPRLRRWDSPWTTHGVAHRLPPPCPHSLHRHNGLSQHLQSACERSNGGKARNHSEGLLLDFAEIQTWDRAELLGALVSMATSTTITAEKRADWKKVGAKLLAEKEPKAT